MICPDCSNEELAKEGATSEMISTSEIKISVISVVIDLANGEQ